MRTRWWNDLPQLAVAVLAITLIVAAVSALMTQDRAVDRDDTVVDGTPVTVYTAGGQRPPGPVIVIAHGFAGSRQLMQAYAQLLARYGYTALTFDFLGHGRHDRPLTGSIVDTQGATQSLLRQLEAVVGHARRLPGAEQGIGLLGHSMAADILVRFTQPRDDAPGQWQGSDLVAGMVGVSMFAPTIDETTPPNLLMIAGQFEGRLIEEARRVASLVAAEDSLIEPGVTVGDAEAGSLRRVKVAAGVEHVGVLYQRAALQEAVVWFDQVFDREDQASLQVPARGVAILVLLAGLVLLAWPLSRWLPRDAARAAASRAAPRCRSWRSFAVLVLTPAILTPLLLWPIPTRFLPVLVADYLALHFAVYGALTAVLLLLIRSRDRVASTRPAAALPTGARALRLPVSGLVATALVVVYGLAIIGHVIDTWLTAFLVTPVRLPLFLAILPGTLLYFLADERLTREVRPVPGASLLSKLAFLVSLAFAVVLDFSGLFFLLIIVPVIVLFFAVYGLFSRWVFARTGLPWVAGTANAVVFAWALAVTFPLLGG